MDTNKNSGLDMLVLEQVDRILAMRQERDAAIARAEKAEAALLECQWRPPGTLPDKREYVLALVYDPLTRPDVRMAILRYQFGDWVEAGRPWFTGRVISWMYQPPAPAYDIKALRNEAQP